MTQTLGYQRTLQATDLWKLDESREAAYLSNKLDESWTRRVENADIWNARLAKGEIRPGLLKRTKWFFQAMKSGSGYSERRQTLEQHWRDVDGRKEASLAWALNDTFGFSFWLGGLFKVSIYFGIVEDSSVDRCFVRFSVTRLSSWVLFWSRYVCRCPFISITN